ncbi:RHS repeat-associated core domain-containing protein, partial [Pectobacterium brasiliense]|uniref:RHS repeat-associated core domain-containing protein n=1 Tax=Pectobacterium brasiliense TaxID=180957 RepID=UPI001CF0FFA0
YYDPAGGCYVSPDPIGVLGGESNYGYVHNPVCWVDPFGLAGCDLLFGQKRISDTFRNVGSDAPDYIRGRSIYDVAGDLKSGVLHIDQLPVSYFIHPQTGQRIAESNRTLAAISAAGMKPTILKEVPVTETLLNRLKEIPLRQRGEIFSMPGSSIPITPGPNNNTILDIIRLVK